MAATVAEVMAHNPVTVNADAPVGEAAQHMRASNAGMCWLWTVAGWPASSPTGRRGRQLRSTSWVVVDVVTAQAAVLFDRVGRIDLHGQLCEVVSAVLDIVDQRLLLDGVSLRQFGATHCFHPLIAIPPPGSAASATDRHQLLTVTEGG